jgi:hypothetical protein
VAFRDQQLTEAKKYSNIMKESIKGLKIENLSIDMPYIQEDESRIARNEDWLKQMQKDIYLEETMLIMKDLLIASDN